MDKPDPATPPAPTFDVLKRWQQEGILTADEMSRATAHPDYPRLGPTVDDVDVLFWLVRHGILTLAELERRGAAWSAAQVEVTTPVDIAVRVLERLRTRPSFEALMAQGWITQEECVTALLNCSDGADDFPSTSHTLAWMLVNRFISAEREAEIFSGQGTTPERAVFLSDTASTLKAFRAYVRTSGDGAVEPRTKSSNRVFLYMILAIALPIAVIFFAFKLPGSDPVEDNPAATASPAAESVAADLPRCDDRLVKSRIVGYLLRFAEPGSDSSAQLLRDLERKAGIQPDVSDAVDSLVKLSAIVEVGTATRPLLRGCRGNLTMSGTTVPIGFVISPSQQTPSTRSVVESLDPAIVQARFGKLAPDGGFLHNAEPIGRDELGRIVRAGFATLRQAPGADLKISGPDGRTRTVGERIALTVDDLEPLAPCVSTNGETAYRCRLLISYSDPMLASGQERRLDGEFSFTRASPTAPWTVSDKFGKEFDTAVAASRKRGINHLATVPDDL